VSLALNDDHIGTEHLLLALLDDELTAQLLGALGTNPKVVRQHLDEVLKKHPESRRGAQSERGQRPSCARCGVDLTVHGTWTRLELPGCEDPEQVLPVVVVHCGVCGSAVGTIQPGS